MPATNSTKVVNKLAVDIAILGGGLVGLTLANLLAKTTDYSIAVIEPNKPKLTWDVNSYDIRVSAVARATQNILRAIEVWSDIVANRVGTYRNVLVWDGTTGAEIAFNVTEFNRFKLGGALDLGHIIENRVMYAALWRKLQQQQQNNPQKIKIIFAKAQQMIAQDDCQELILLQNDGRALVDTEVQSIEDQIKIQARLIIGADGANSWLRQYQRIAVDTWGINQHALVATIQTTRPHNNVAYQIFNSAEPLAFLPLNDPHISSIVWYGEQDLTQARINLAPEKFCKHLDQAFDCKLGESSLLGARAQFPIKPMHANSYLGNRTILVGDAAHVVHPLAGQGLNLGVRDIAVLAELLLKHGLSNTSVGLRKTLRKYERQRRGENLAMLNLGVGLQALFGADYELAKILRSNGLQLVNKVAWFKQVLAFKAMGISNFH